MSSERKTTFLCAGLLFAVTAAFIILKSARDGLFLSDYSARTLPYFMAITTVATALLAATYLRLYKAISLGPAVELSLKVFGVGTLILWAGVKSHWAYATPILYVWTGVFGTIAPVQSWSLISQQLLARQAKKDLGIIGSGGILGASVGGLFAKWVVHASTVSTLLPTATILILLALFATQALTALSLNVQTSTRETDTRKVRSRFITLVLIVVGTVTIASTFADFQFKVIVQREMYTAEKLAGFFGLFYAYVGIATLAFQLLLTPRLMSRVGVSSALAIFPLGLAIGNGWVLSAASLASAICLKGTEQMFKHSVQRSSLEVLYMAIPDAVKIRLKSLIDTLGVQASEGIGAVLLILMFSVGKLPFSLVAVLSLIMLGISVVCTILLGYEYPKALTSAIQRQELSFSGIKTTFFTSDFYHLLPDLLQTSSKETLIDVLQLLAATGNRKMSAYVVSLLDHREADIRLKALELLFTQEDDVSTKVEQMVSDPDPRVRVEAIRYLCFRSSIDPLTKLALLLRDPNPTVQAAACACSLNLDVEPIQQAAYKRLEELVTGTPDSTRLEVRLEVARILEHIQPSPSSEQLCRLLLKDPSIEVQKIALRSIGHMRSQVLQNDLLHLMDNPALRTEVRQAFASYGDPILPALKNLLTDPKESQDKKKLSLKIAADIASAPARELLIQYAGGSNLVLRFIAIKALNRIRKRQALLLPKASLDNLLNQEIVSLEVEHERIRYFQPKHGGVMEKVLNQRQRWAQERIFRVLGLLYESRTVYNAYKAITGMDPRRADAAIEWLDTILSPEHRHRVVNLLEAQSSNGQKNLEPGTRKAVLFSYLGAQDQLPAAALVADLNDQELMEWQGEIQQALKVFPNLPLVEETLNWRYASMGGPDSLARKLTTIQKIEKLGKVDIFSDLGPNELLLLSNQCTEEEFAPGEFVFKEGDPPQEIYLLIEGSIELTHGAGQLTMVQEGESFGTLSVLGGQPRLFSARAVKQSYCLKIDRDSFWDILEDYPAICQGIFKILAQRVGTMVNQTSQARVPS